MRGQLAPTQQWTRTNLRRVVVFGAGGGFIFGALASALFQLFPRLRESALFCFSGAPQGLDEWVYITLAQAVWRSPTRFTYEYPFDLFWPTPPVMLQLPITLAAWLAAIVGYPLAFEILRVVGSSVTGAAVGALGYFLFGRSSWRQWFYILAAFGGAWFTFLGIVEAVKTAGAAGLFELPIYVARAMGSLFWWLPFLAQNVWLPLEAVYHALVIGALALICAGAVRRAALLGMLAWFSNPFPAVSLYAAVVPWLALEAYLAREFSVRQRRLQELILWATTGLVGYAYYAWFLPQWPVLRELSRMHRAPLAPPPTFAQLAAWLGPFVPAMIWSVGSGSGRRHVWRSASWRLMVVLCVSQLAFLLQFPLLRDSATQPYHFNRGYLAIGSVALLVRWLQFYRPAAPHRFVRVLFCTLLFDQCFFFIHALSEGLNAGLVPREVCQIASTMRQQWPTQLFYSRAHPYSVYLAAASGQIPYDMPETMVVPWPKERAQILTAAISRGSAAIEQLGVTMMVLANTDELTAPLTEAGWHALLRTQNYVLLKSPARKPVAPPRLPPPREAVSTREKEGASSGPS
jgi:hypothetical protein